jgi:hypothetical protein
MALLELARLQLLELQQHTRRGIIYVYTSEQLRNGNYADIEHMIDVDTYADI